MGSSDNKKISFLETAYGAITGRLGRRRKSCSVITAIAFDAWRRGRNYDVFVDELARHRNARFAVTGTFGDLPTPGLDLVLAFEPRHQRRRCLIGAGQERSCVRWVTAALEQAEHPASSRWEQLSCLTRVVCDGSRFKHISRKRRELPASC